MSSFAAATPPTVAAPRSEKESARSSTGGGGGGGEGGAPSCARAPVAWSREKTETALLKNDAAYTVAPSGLTATDLASARAMPSAQAPPVPVSLTQAAIPASCVIAPVVAFREKTATPSVPSAAT